MGPSFPSTPLWNANAGAAELKTSVPVTRVERRIFFIGFKDV